MGSSELQNVDLDSNIFFFINYVGSSELQNFDLDSNIFLFDILLTHQGSFCVCTQPMGDDVTL